MNFVSVLPRDKILKPELPENASFKLVGLGGVGGIVARYLTLFLASLNRNVRLVFVDGDSFEPSNTARMLFGGYGNKSEVVRADLLPCVLESRLSLLAIDEYVNRENIDRLISNGDVVLVCVDNHATRKLLDEYCSTLRDVCVISGGNDGIERTAGGRQSRGTYGNVQVHVRRAGEDLTPSLVRYHPEIANPTDKLPTDRSCTELMTSVPQILFANLTVAAAMLNALWLHLCGALHYGELSLDIAERIMRPAQLTRNDCAAEGA